MSNRPGYAIQEYHDTRKVMDQLNALIKMPIRGIKKEAMEKYLDYYETKCQKSKAMIQEAMNYIPGGVQHNLAFNYPFPLVMTKAEGAYLYDIDGNQYIDFLQAGGPTVLGSNPPKIREKVKELLEQNADKIRKLCPELKIGIYSAGLRSRDTKEQVIVAGIQSVYTKACELDAFDLVIVDEAHLISSEGDGMYRSFLADMKVINPHVRVIGLTATPFRLKGGLICKPENILNEICYEAGLKEMIQQGYLSPLISRAGRAEANLATSSSATRSPPQWTTMRW